jgi:hypothetical protein
MKKITLFAFAIAALSLASCKKDRTCECTYTSTSGSSSVTTSSTVIKEVKKSEAKTLCQKTTYTDNLSAYSSTSDCKLK